LSLKSSHAGPRYFEEPSVVDIGDDFEQLLDTPAPDSCDDRELRKVRSDKIDDSRVLANEGSRALLLWHLGRRKGMFGLVTASQITSASAASFFCRLT
jgi:hypothetical protein